ncbi:MAG: signal transduction histidine kinase [Phenylobacterium sp.]|nr:signal transduction histidine kinase [Phenylobacterium sp.]
MFDSLSNIDLPRRLDAVAPRALTRVAVAVALLSVVGLVRLAIDAVVPGVTPFALLYPAVLLATLLAGWISGGAVMAIGGLLVWYLVLGPRHSFHLTAPHDVVSMILYFASASAVIALAEAFRASAPRLASGAAALRESEARLELAVAAARLGVWEWRRGTGAMTFSAEAKAICGFPPDASVTIETIAAITHRGDRLKAREQNRRALDPDRRDDSTYEYRIITPAGEQRRVAVNGRAVFETVAGVTRAIRYIGTMQDITAQRAAEAERAQGSTRLRLAIEAGRMAVWQVDGRGIVSSPELNRILGFPEDARTTLADVNGLYLPGEQERTQKIAQAALARGERYVEGEYRIRRPDGEVRWLLTRAEVQVNDRGQPRSVTGVVMDVTERKDSEERLKLLAREVDHRANNLLAVVQATVQLSQASSAEALKAVLMGRVAALGRAHQLLSEARWEGADLRRLVEEELLAFSLGEATRVSIRGEDVALPPAAAQALAMALHELATNAVKYGALSTPEGQVAVSWAHVRRGPLTIRWAESGGPVVARPTRRGLGAAMLARALGGALRGETRMDWRAEGLVCELELPGEAVEPAAVG